MTEDFIKYLWKFQLLQQGLHTSCGEEIRVYRPGFHNPNAGPDFLNAKIRIAQTLWVGNVEIHVRSSDWLRHGHQADHAYMTVILHVVYVDDLGKQHSEHIPAPLLCLKEKFEPELLMKYKYFMEATSWIPCEKLIGTVDKLLITNSIYRNSISRLESKVNKISELYSSLADDMEATLYHVMARSFGGSLNADAFGILCHALPFQVIRKYLSTPVQLSALIFGQAGFLGGDFRDIYPLKLKIEYKYLMAKHQLVPLDSSIWKFLRLRPHSFPTVRLAQWAGFLQFNTDLINKVLELRSKADLVRLFDFSLDHYWEDHFLFERKSKPRMKQPGLGFMDGIMINSVVPFIYFHGMLTGNEAEKRLGLALLESLPPEQNSVTERWERLGIVASNAQESQGLIEMKLSCCDQKKCLHCIIGNRLIREPVKTGQHHGE